MDEKIKKIITSIVEKTKNLSTEEKLLKFVDIYDICSDLYPEETQSVLKNTGLQSDMELWISEAKELMKICDSFKIDHQSIEIEMKKDDEVLRFPLVNVKEYIKEKYHLTEESTEFTLILSYLAKSKNFELFQIANAIILS